MTTAHDTSISWMDCPVCAELNRKFERADAEANEAWERFSFFEATYREAFAAGMVGFGTTAWTQWHDLLDQLRHAYYDAADAHRTRLEAWGESIRKHAKPQPAAEPEERKITISKADATDELVNVYGGHIDKWLEALRERSFGQTEEMPAIGKEDTGYDSLRAVAAINALDDAGLCVAADLLYHVLDDVTDLLRLDPHRLDGYRTQLTKTVFWRSDHESTQQPHTREHALADGEGEKR